MTITRFEGEGKTTAQIVQAYRDLQNLTDALKFLIRDKYRRDPGQSGVCLWNSLKFLTDPTTNVFRDPGQFLRTKTQFTLEANRRRG